MNRRFLGKDIGAIVKNISHLIASKIGLATQKMGSSLQKPSPVDKKLQIPIVIFQPGKVGSITVQKSLETAFAGKGIETPIFHAHYLKDIDERIRFISSLRADPSKSLEKLRASQELYQKIIADASQPWNIVSLVRDPLAIMVSSLFQNLHEYLPDWQERSAQNRLDLSEIKDILLSGAEFKFSRFDSWFDQQIKGIWQLDIFATPFEHAKGFEIYQKGPHRLIVIRLEDLNRVGVTAFQEFIGLDNFQIINSNVASDKPYSQIYEQFKKTVALPVSYVDSAYQTRYAEHFYTPDEIQKFRQKWLSIAD